MLRPRLGPALLLLGTIALAGCDRRPAAATATTGSPDSAAARVTALADRYVAAYFEAFPQQATLLGVAAGPHDRLSDLSPEAVTRWKATEDSIFAGFEAIDTAAVPVGSAAAVTLGFMREFVRNSRDWRVCRMELWNVSPTWTGWQSELTLLANSQPLGTPEKNEAAFRRFSGLPHYLDQEIANLRAGLSRGYSAPKGNVRAVIAIVHALLAAPVAQSPFVAMADSAESLRPRLTVLERDGIRPAMRRYRDFLRDEYLPKAREAVGVSANPDGAACYRAAIRYHSTVDIPPEEVHRIGLAQMDSIRSEMRTIAARSFGSTDVDAVLRRLRTDPRYLFKNRDSMLAVAQGATDRARAALPKWFNLLPKADVVIQAVPSFSEASAPGGFYNNPAEDGSRPGIYYINLYRAEQQPRAGLEATAFHETYPGHHLQGAIALERKELHPASRYLYLSGFGEGWALYTERLADEMGLYSSDVDRMGQLSNDALRASRLVVDAGMHALGWSRARAIEYMRQHTAESDKSVASEVDRYIAVPGQATSYMLGSLEIRRLRKEAETAQGGAFDIRAFHDRVLEDGAVPLMLLREKIRRWSAAVAGSGTAGAPRDSAAPTR
jgi:uncharacterized protein (DUF885 family)